MAKKSDNKVNVVLGTVTNRQGRALANLIVKIYDRDMRSEEVLGETVTNKDGKYEVNWQHEQLKGRGKKGADIMVKVYASEKGALLFNTGPDSIIYNASSREEVNITIQGKVPQEDIEFDRIVKEVEFLANKVEIVDLREDKEHHDISFLVGETGYDADKIEHVVVAHRLEKESKIDAPFFYALLRQQSFFKADISTLSTRLSINTDTDTRSLLFQAALIAPAVIQRDVEAAVESKMVDGKKVKVRKNIETLSRLRNEATEYFRNEFPQKAFESVTRFVMSGKIQAATKLFDENKNDLDGFFRKLVDSDLFENEKDANDAETNLKMGKLFGFGNNIIPHLLASKEINRPDDIKKLAKLNKKDWEVEFRKASGTEEGNDEAAKAIGIFSSLIVRKMERTFPTAAFSAQLARESKVLKNQEPIINFFNKFEDFDLVNSNVDLFLKEKKVPVQEGNVIKEELKSMQRIFKLAPQYKVTKALLSKNIHSAQSIARIGETRFIKEVAPNAGISSKEAKEIFAKANRVNTAAMLLVGELQDTMRAVDIASIETSGLAKKLDAVSKDFPNLKSLFKIADACACEHCRSVYSPAAYLVEILQFIKDRSVTDVTTTPATPNKLAKEVLFARRPDLGEIDLGCENANTPVKYIDLVCELLEEAIAPDAGINFTGNLSDGSNPLHGKISADLLAALEAAGLPVTNDALIFESEVESASADALPHYLRDKKVVCKIEGTGGNNFKVFQLRQTLSSAEELAAAPEYVNTAAYTELSTKKYAFKLPFDLNHAEASAYFNRFDLSRAQLMKDFQVANVPADAVIAAERLGLTSAERDLIIKLRATTAEQQEIWNAPAQWDEPPVTGDVLVYMKRVDHFLDKTNVDYKGLDLLLLLKYIDPADNLFIKHLDESCQTEKKEIANFDLAALDRLHRFLRLQKKTGWKFEVLDEIIMQPKLGAGLLDDGDVNANGISNGDECLINAARLSEISTKINLKIDELIGFYGEIPHTIIKEDLPRPLYYQLFLNKAKNGFIDGGLLPENVDGTQPIANVKDSIAVCLQLKLKDLEKLLVLLPDQQLRFSNLSFLFGASRLIRKLKVKIDDFINLFELTGINFSESPQKTMEFIEAVETFRKSPHKTSDVKFYLRHEATVIPSIDDKINQLLVQLQQQYVENLKVNGSKFDDKLSAAEQKATIQSEISKLSGVAEDDVKKLLSFVDRDWTLAADAKDVVSNKLNAVLSAAQVTTINGKIDVLDAAALTNFTTERNDLADTFIGILDASVVLGGLNFEQKRSILQGLLSKLDVVNENDVFAIINFIDFRRISNVEAKQFADDKFEFDVTAINTAIDNLFAANNAAKLQAQKDVVKELLNAFGSFQLNSGKKNILEQVIATSLKGEGEMVKVILKFARLKQPVQANPPLLSTILQSDALIQMTGVPPVLPDINNVDFPEQYAAIKLLSKLIPFIVSLKLSVEDAAWFFEHNKDLGWFEPDTIPYTSGQINGDYAKYIAFVEVASLLKLFEPVPDPADPQISISFFTIADMLLLPVGSVTKAKFIETLSLLTGYDKDNLDAIDTHLLSPFAIANYKEVSNWNNVIKCAEHLRVMGADTAQVKEYIKEVLLAADVRSLRTLLKSRYDEDTWLSTLKEIMDAIRPRKRNALVAHLLAGNPEMKDENDLFDYFLIDVEMESCMPSSRIVQAHGTVQLFVTRCLMGLEPKAAADIEHDKSWNRWKWMKNYRVWEANRKVFLYPENWIEAELRDDKSFLFAELENEIQQNELNEFTAEEALRRYLEKLDNIAFLEVMASWYQTDIKTMHVFARTKGGDPGIYYYRRFEKERYWTPWEKVDLDITGDHLLAFVRNNRLCLAWPVFSELEDPNQGATIPNQTLPQGTEQPVDRPRKKLKIQIAISEFANKKWQPKRISKEGILTPHVFTTNSTYFRRDIYYFTYFPLPKNKKFAISDIICVFAQPNHKEFQDEQQLIGVFNVAGCKGYPELLFSGNKNIRLPDFLPDFNDTALLLQRYKEQNGVPGDDLSVRNGVTIFKSFNFLNLLAETPGIFRISFPHQFTKIDIVSLLFQLLLSLVNNSSFKLSTHPQRRRFKIPMGTLLPYFKEDSNHAYVIIPGFYKKIMDPGEFVQSFTLSDEEKRTASDALKLLEDLFALIKLYIQKFKDDPAHDINLLLQQLVSDEEFHRIIKELTAYEGFVTQYF